MWLLQRIRDPAVRIPVRLEARSGSRAGCSILAQQHQPLAEADQGGKAFGSGAAQRNTSTSKGGENRSDAPGISSPSPTALALHYLDTKSRFGVVSPPAMGESPYGVRRLPWYVRPATNLVTRST